MGCRARRTGRHLKPAFPKLTYGQAAITWIGHASFLVQFTDLNVLIDPNFANWLFLLKRIKRSGLKIQHLPRIDLVLLTHAHFDHFHKPTLRRLPNPKIAVMPCKPRGSRRWPFPCNPRQSTFRNSGLLNSGARSGVDGHSRS